MGDLARDPLGDPLVGDPLEDDASFEIQDEPFESYGVEDEPSWLSNDVMVIEESERNEDGTGKGMEDIDDAPNVGVFEFPSSDAAPKVCVPPKHPVPSKRKGSSRGERKEGEHSQVVRQSQKSCAELDEDSMNEILLAALERKRIKEEVEKIKQNVIKNRSNIKKVRVKDKSNHKRVKVEQNAQPFVKQELHQPIVKQFKQPFVVKQELKQEVSENECTGSDWETRRLLEAQLAQHKANIKRFQSSLQEEKVKMLRVQNSLINLRRKIRRRELKKLKTNAYTSVKQENVDQLLDTNAGIEELAEEANENKRKLVENLEIQESKKLKSFQEQAIHDTEPQNVQTDVKIKAEKKEVPAYEVQEESAEKVWNELTHENLKEFIEYCNVDTSDKPKQIFKSVTDNVPKQLHNSSHMFDVCELVTQFLLREDITKPAPASSEEDEAASVRYRLHYLRILHKQFEAEFGSLCNYDTFCDYCPKTIVKPDTLYWKNCACIPCINPDIKYEKLISEGLLQDCGDELPDILLEPQKESDLMAQLEPLRESVNIIRYQAWERNSCGTINAKRRSSSEPLNLFVAKFTEELRYLKTHIRKTFGQLEAAKMARERALSSPDEVTFHVDSSPLNIYPHIDTDVIAKKHTMTLMVLGGYTWSQNGGQSFVAMSKNKEYTCTGLWAGLENALLKVVEAGIRKINIISDCPTNRYKNKSNFYYMGDFADTYGVAFRWIFLELCHGLGNAFNVKSEFDQAIRNRLAENPSCTPTSCSDVIDLVQGHLSPEVYTYTDQDVQKYKWLLPKLRTIDGTQKVTEVIIFPGGFWVRNLVNCESFRRCFF